MAETPPIIVITEPGSRRHQLMAAHLAEVGVEAEWSPAVFPAGEFPWSEAYDVEDRLRLGGQAMRRGEVGCFLAHREVWKKVLRSGSVCLVLEDDARLPAHRLAELAVAAEHIRGQCMLVRLFSSQREKFRPWKDLPGGACLGLPVHPGSSAVAYLITAESAVSLLGESERFSCPVDQFINQRHLHGVTVLSIEPEFAVHDSEFPSGLGLQARVSLGFWGRLRTCLCSNLGRWRLRFAAERAAWRLGIRSKCAQKPKL